MNPKYFPAGTELLADSYETVIGGKVIWDKLTAVLELSREVIRLRYWVEK